MHKKNLTNHMMKVHGYPKPHAVSFPDCFDFLVMNIDFMVKIVFQNIMIEFQIEACDLVKTYLYFFCLLFSVHSAPKPS